MEGFFSELFRGKDKNGKKQNSESEEQSPYTTLNIPKDVPKISHQEKKEIADDVNVSVRDVENVERKMKETKSETEKALEEKFSDKKIQYNDKTRNLQIENEIQKLRDETYNQDYKKEIGTLIQKQQPMRSENFEEKDMMSLRNSQDVFYATQDPIKENTKVINKEIQKTMNCKFLSSPKCHPDYPHFSGASFSFPDDSKLKCDSLETNKPASAICTISKGRINGVYVIDGGEGYENEPRIKIIGGGGKDAILKPKVKDGKIIEIKVIHGGFGFIETPSIEIENPNVSNGCYLCCK